MDFRTKELEYLLDNYWCIKEDNPNQYFNIKNNLDYYRDFIQDKLGSRLIVNDRFIKLEKIPAVPKPYMGIMDFSDKLEYIILFIILIFLEDKPKLEQFILSNLIDFIPNTATSLGLDTVPNWNILHHRKSLVNVINHLKDLKIIKIVEEHSLFTDDKQAEALYETTGISNYYIREFRNNILEYNNLKDYISDEFSNQNENVGDVRRYRVYRHLLFSLATYVDDLTESEHDYLKKFRGSIDKELKKYIEGDFELTRSMALLLLDPNARKKFDFPNNKAISDIVLMVNNNILKQIDNNQLTLDINEVLTINEEQLHRIIKNTRNDNLPYLSKNHREMTQDNFINEVITYMKEYDFIREYEYGYKIYPSISKLTGYIPKDDTAQLTLFGGEV